MHEYVGTLASRSIVWLTGPTSSLLVISTPLPGGGGQHEGRDLLQHVELSWGSAVLPPKANLIGTSQHNISFIYALLYSSPRIHL